MNPIASIMMGSASDLPVLEEAAKLLDETKIPFEMNALAAHRTLDQVLDFDRNAGIIAIQIIRNGESEVQMQMIKFKQSLAKKIEASNQELSKVKFDYKLN